MAERIYADTNVIVRYLIDDPPEQAKIVEDLLQSLKLKDKELYICNLVLAEAVYVLESFYKYPKAEISDRLLSFCLLPGVITENRSLVKRALGFYAQHNVDFTDAYVAADMERRGSRIIFTFDKDFRKFGFVSLVGNNSAP